MINSMTGFAGSELSTAAGTLTWEVRTVNHRYLETQFKLPDGFRALEPELRDLVGSRLARGKLDAALTFRPAEGNTAKLRLNHELVAQLIERMREIEDELHTTAPLASIDVLRWPGVLSEETLDTAELFAPAKQAFETALDSLVEARAREGERIQMLIEDRLVTVGELVSSVKARLPEVLEAVRQRIQERAEALAAKLDNERLEQELVMLAQKMDVAEELDRLDAHVAEARGTLATSGAVGRKLDFLMQEFNREANTLGSKSADAETTRAAVELKVLIEQMREQVQNVE